MRAIALDGIPEPPPVMTCEVCKYELTTPGATCAWCAAAAALEAKADPVALQPSSHMHYNVTTSSASFQPWMFSTSASITQQSTLTYAGIPLQETYPENVITPDPMDHASIRALALSHCAVFRPRSSLLDSCFCGNSREQHSQQQIEAWIASSTGKGHRW